MSSAFLIIILKRVPDIRRAMVKVFIEREKRSLEEEFSGRISALLEKVGVNAETVVVVKNGEVVSEDERCAGDDEIRLLSVISGG